MRKLVKIKCPTCWKTGRYEYDMDTCSKYIECENCKQKILLKRVMYYVKDFLYTEKIKNKFTYDNSISEKIGDTIKTRAIETEIRLPYMFYNENEPLEALNWINEYKKVIYFEFKQTGTLYFKIDYETLGLREGNKITFNGEEFIIDNTLEEIKGV